MPRPLHASSSGKPASLTAGSPSHATLSPDALAAFGQSGKAALWVYFTDKGETDAASFARAVARSAIPVSPESKQRRARATGGRFLPDYSDVPAVPRYVQGLELAGARIRHVSRWLNAASVEVDEAGATRIAALPYVRRITAVARTGIQYGPPGDYGNALIQNTGINSVAANDSGYGGAGVVVAVFDTGFRKDHLATAPMKRLAEWDFVQSDSETGNQPGDIPQQWDHGTSVWSIIGGYLPGSLVGPAYNATFVLAKTRDLTDSSGGDEDHWVAAAQWADSIGVDIVSSSHVAYYEFPDKDGASTPMAQAANTLARHGILVVCAMGNSGPDPGSLWTPSDADSILAVGSVDSDNTISSFSSRGPTFDGRGKPDLVALGEATYGADPACADCVTGGYGTSFATPLVSGAAALVQEAHPEWTAQQVRYALKSTGDKASTPDSTTYGWGRPDVVQAIYHSTLGGPIFPKPFSLVAPAFGASVAGTPVTFRWRRAIDLNPGDVVSYTLELRRASTGMIVYTTSTPDTFVTYGGSLTPGTTYEWTVRAKDLANHTREGVEPYPFTTTGGQDLAPTVTAPSTASVLEGSLLWFGVTAADPDGDPIASLTAAPLPSGATFAPNGANTSGTFNWTPDFTQAGTVNVTFTATNARSGNATTQITVTNVDRAPVVTAPASRTVNATAALSFTVTASDPDGDAIASLTVDTSVLPAGHDAVLTPNPSNTSGTFTWHPAPADTGVYLVAFTAANALTGPAASTSIQVSAPSAAPSLGATPDTTGLEEFAMQLVASASDPEASETLTISVTGAPASLTYSHTPAASFATATLTGTLTQGDADGSPYNIVWSVNDGCGGTAQATTVLHVTTVTAVGSPDESAGPPRVVHFGNRPNPFQAATQIEFRIQGRLDAPIALRIYDSRGRLVRTLLEHSTRAAASVPWDGRTDAGVRAASGVYYYRLEMGSMRLIRRLILLK
jgi:hypothetical protein